jgi:hypothetical protein
MSWRDGARGAFARARACASDLVAVRHDKSMIEDNPLAAEDRPVQVLSLAANNVAGQ